MSFYCINTKPRQEEIPENMRYIFITKEYPQPKPPEGKKRCTKEQNEQYKEMVEKRNQMFTMLDSGHYDIGNALIELSAFVNNLSGFVDIEKDYIYKIKPINSCKSRERYSNRDTYYVSKFDVEKRIDNIYELIDDLSDSIYYADLFNYVFDRGRFANDGYRDYSIKLFKYAKTNYPDKKIFLSDCIKRVLHSYEHDGRYNDTPNMEDYVKELLDSNLIELTQEYDDQESTVKNLIKACWFDICQNYIEAMPENIRDVYLRDIQKDDSVMNVLRKNSDKENVKKIISLLGIEDSCVTLTVLSEGEWEDENVEETKVFKDMNEVRGYVISQYKVPFEDACKDVQYWRGENDEWFRIS